MTVAISRVLREDIDNVGVGETNVYIWDEDDYASAVYAYENEEVVKEEISFWRDTFEIKPFEFNMTLK